jgi:hypothetical protein
VAFLLLATHENAEMRVALLVCFPFLAIYLASAPLHTQNLDTHPVRLDGEGKLMSWVTPQDSAYGHVAKLSADFIKAAMVGPIDPANGLPTIYTHSEYHPTTFVGSGWPNHPAGRNSMLADSLTLYYAYSGDTGALDAVRALLDYQLSANGTTPVNYVWAKVPWSASAASNPQYGTDNISEGVGNIEPDKFGELGDFGYLRFYKITGEAKYRDAAIACADALATHIRTGNTTQSPWPYRVNAQTGAVVEEYCAHIIAPIRLFDELIRLNLGNVAAYQAARATAWNWLMTYPIANNFWTKYFEDVGIDDSHSGNLNQYNPGQTVRYFLERPDLNPNWQTHSTNLINWIGTTFGGTDQGEPGLQYGARVISEQYAYKFKMASHTSRFAAICAMLAEKTGDLALKEKAFRSLNWCTYMARTTGSVIEGPFEFAANQNNWFSDGHGDYIRHFILAMGAFPEWAPATESHILRSTSVVKSVTYSPTSITYSTFDPSSTETLRVAGGILNITANGVALAQRSDLNAEGYVIDGSGALRIRHNAATNIVINFDPALIPPSVSLSVSGTLVAPSNVTLNATASHPNGITKVEFFEGANLLGEDTTAPYEFVWRNVPVGSFAVRARATNTNSLTATTTGTVTIASPTAPTQFGNTSEGNTTDYITDGSGAYINACRFVASADQQLTVIKAKVDAITGKYQCAIYGDVGGNASALLRATNEVTPAANGWHTFTLTAPLQATNGTAYWLAIWSNDTNARVHADNGGTLKFAAYPYGAWPNPVNLTGSGGFTYCIYATGPGKTAYQQWKQNNGLPELIDPNGDYDQDGLQLLAEYGLGTAPAASDIAPFAAVLDGSHLTLTYTKAKAATDITVRAEVSDDLANWSSAAADVAQQWQLLDGTTQQTITARDLTPSPPATRRFMRVRVTNP